jgi:sugar (pentulose or hexulose) kinase
MQYALPLKLCARGLGIDLGTSGVRVVAVSDSAAILGHAQAKLETTPEPDEPATQDPWTWWSATRTALLALGQQIDLAQIQALSIDATSGTVLAVDRQGRPLGRARMYNDTALPTTLAALASILPEDSAARGATSPLARMIEMQQPGVHKIIHQADWLTGQFSGRFDVSDESNALKSGFDVIARTWPNWMGHTPLDPLLLPEVVPTGTDLGPIRPEVAAQLGFNKNLRIVSGTTDGCASFLASGARAYGDGVTSLGTTLTLKQVCSKPIAVAKYGIYSHRLADRWLCGGASNSGGAVLLQFFSRERIAELETQLNPTVATNLNYYPLPSVGERFPHAIGSLGPCMEPRPPDDARFLQGLFEGIAAIEKTGYSRLQEFGAPALKRVFTVGGGARNQAWRLIRERVLGVSVRQGFADAAYGTALLALASVKQQPLFASDGHRLSPPYPPTAEC